MRQTIQDLVTREFKAVQAKLESQAKQIEMIAQQATVQHDAMLQVIDAFRVEMRSEFAALRAANRLEVMRQVSSLSERIAVVERR